MQLTVLIAEVEALRGAPAATYNTAYQRAKNQLQESIIFKSVLLKCDREGNNHMERQAERASRKSGFTWAQGNLSDLARAVFS